MIKQIAPITPVKRNKSLFVRFLYICMSLTTRQLKKKLHKLKCFHFIIFWLESNYNILYEGNRNNCHIMRKFQRKQDNSLIESYSLNKENRTSVRLLGMTSTDPYLRWSSSLWLGREGWGMWCPQGHPGWLGGTRWGREGRWSPHNHTYLPAASLQYKGVLILLLNFIFLLARYSIAVCLYDTDKSLSQISYDCVNKP